MVDATPEPEVTRWRRYGKDRLYVTDASGARVGWWDLLTEESHPETSELEAALQAAVRRWLATSEESPGRPPQDPSPAGGGLVASPSAHSALGPVLVDPSPTNASAACPHPTETSAEPLPMIATLHPVDTVEADLSLVHPGALARQQAEALRSAAPVRTFLARALRVHTDERAWRIGADGEEKTAARLAKVARRDPRWHFLHAVPVGERGSDIDHVAVGPGGVFTINTKHHPGSKVWVGGDTFMVNGHRHHYIRNSRHEAARASRWLSAVCGFEVPVTGMIVTVRAEVTIKAAPEDVVVVPRLQVSRWFAQRPVRLDDRTIDAVFAAARHPSTWRS